MVDLPGILVNHKVLYSKPSAVENDQKRKRSQGSISVRYIPCIDEGCGQVYQACNHCPGGVGGQPIQYDPGTNGDDQVLEGNQQDTCK
jgi:hypothetical protein